MRHYPLNAARRGGSGTGVREEFERTRNYADCPAAVLQQPVTPLCGQMSPSRRPRYRRCRMSRRCRRRRAEECFARQERVVRLKYSNPQKYH